MYRYMLDTDTCSYIMKRSDLAVLTKLRSIPPAEVCISVVTKAELIGANDLFIAAHARCLGLTLVTNNMEEFRRVDELRVENWTLPEA